MINATDARIETEARVEQLAKEFIINTCSDNIRKAIDDCEFSCNVTLNNIPNCKVVAPKVVELLEKEYNYSVTLYEGTGTFEKAAYITIDWKES